MKSAFSTSWVASKQPRKQRKYQANAPLHLKHRFLNAHLSAELRKKYGKRSIPLKKGDEVVVMRGTLKKKKAKVSDVDAKRGRVTLENVSRSKRDGTKVNTYFRPSNLIIHNLNLEDKKRIRVLERKKIVKEKENAPNKS